MSNKKTFHRGSITVELDREEVFPDDPGQGTPAMVFHRDRSGAVYSATYWCACDTGELDGDAGCKRLREDDLEWLDGLDSDVNDFLFGEQK